MICIVKNSHCFRKQPGCSTVLRLLKCSRCNTFSGKGNAQGCTDISLYKSQNLCTDIQMLVYSQTILRAQCDIPRATWQNETQHSETPELLSVIFKVCALGRWWWWKVNPSRTSYLTIQKLIIEGKNWACFYILTPTGKKHKAFNG